jgi:crossover junction endodeoxyribonuclease RuvC
VSSADAADALAVAICHAHNATTTRRWAETKVQAKVAS